MIDRPRSTHHWEDRIARVGGDFHPPVALRPAGGQEVQDVPGDLPAGGRGDPCGAGERARSLGGVLLDRPGPERGVDPGDGGRPLGVGAGLPRRQGGAWSRTAAVASCVGQRGGVEPDRLVAHAGGAMGLGPAQVQVVRPERLAVGPGGAPSVARQSLSGVTSRGDAGGIFVAAVRGGLAPENPPVHQTPHRRFSRPRNLPN